MSIKSVVLLSDKKISGSDMFNVSDESVVVVPPTDRLPASDKPANVTESVLSIY